MWRWRRDHPAALAHEPSPPGGTIDEMASFALDWLARGFRSRGVDACPAIPRGSALELPINATRVLNGDDLSRLAVYLLKRARRPQDHLRPPRRRHRLRTSGLGVDLHTQGVTHEARVDHRAPGSGRCPIPIRPGQELGSMKLPHLLARPIRARHRKLELAHDQQRL